MSRELWDRVQDVFDDRYQGQRDTSRAGEFAYPGMVRCGLCGSAMSPYIVKERCIYYRCAGAHGPCEAKQVREEMLDREFARALRGIVLPPLWMEFWVAPILRSPTRMGTRCRTKWSVGTAPIRSCPTRMGTRCVTTPNGWAARIRR